MNPSPSTGAPFVTPATGSAPFVPPVHPSGELPVSSPYVFPRQPDEITHPPPNGSESVYGAQPPTPPAPPPPPQEVVTPKVEAPTVQRQIVVTEAPTVVRQPATPVAPAFDLETVMHENVNRIIDDGRKNTSSINGWRRVAVALASVLDLVSTFVRVTNLGLSLLLPTIYALVNTPPANASGINTFFHFAIPILSLAGIAFGAPAALLAAGYRAVSTIARLEAAADIPNKAKRKEAKQELRMQVLASFVYLFIAFISLALLAVPTFIANNPAISEQTKAIIGEAALVILPVVLMIILLLTERDLLLSMKQMASTVSTYGSLYSLAEASVRLARGHGSSNDAQAVTSGLNGRIDKVLAAGVEVAPREEGVKYLSLGDVQVMMGGDYSKDDPRRRGISRVAREAMGTKLYGIYLDPKTGYMIPRDFYAEVFGDYAKKHPASSFVQKGTPGSSQVEKRWSKGGAKQASGVGTASDEGGQLVAKTFIGRLRQIFINPEKAS